MKSSFWRLFVTLMVGQFGNSCLFGQEPAYLHYGVSDGLPSSLVYCTAQDHNGFIWFGTDKGLVRFDGTRFKVFGMQDGLPDSDVLNIFEDSKHRLWISCFQNNPCYMLNGKFFTSENDSQLKKLDLKGGVFSFSEDEYGSLWITKDQDKYCKITIDDKIFYFYPPLDIVNAPLPRSESKKKVTIQRIGRFGNQTFAFGGWAIINITDPKKNFVDLSFGDIVGLDNLLSVEISGNYALLSFGTFLVLVKYENGCFALVDKTKINAGSRVTKDKKGRFWVSSQLNGAVNFDLSKNMLNATKSYLKDEKITDTFEDRDGNYWFSSLNNGVFELPKNSGLKYAKNEGIPLYSNNILSLSKSSNGGIMIGDDSGNLYFINGQNFIRKNLGSKDGYNRVLQIEMLTDNNWLAVSEEGIHDSQGGNINEMKLIGAPKSVFTNNGNIWFGTSGGVFFMPFFNSAPQRKMSIRTTAISADSENNIWAGGLNGLYSQKDSFQFNWGNRFKPLSKRIISIKKANKNILWIATSEHGLLKISTKEGTITRLEIINDSLATPINNIQSIFVEGNENVWVTSNKGIYMIDPNYNVLHFDESNGLVSNNVNSMLVDNDTLWAATTAGLSKILLNDQGENSNFPTHIVEVNYFNNNQKFNFIVLADVPNSHSVTLPASATMLQTELAGLNFRSRGNLQFEYETQEHLLPVHLFTFGNLFNCLFDRTTNKNLIFGTSQNFGVNLTPGKFVSTVTAILSGGTRSTSPDHITITILPYWWQTIWFSLSLVILVGYGIWRMIKARSNYLKLQSTASELQLQAIKSQMNPHFVGNSINAIQQFFYPPDPVKASEYISIFSDLLRRTMTFSEIDFIPFQEEMRYVKDYLQMVKLRFGDQFSYEILGEERVDPATKFPAMLLQPILENATIHGLSPDNPSKLTVSFEAKGDHVYCTLTDNGVGINESLRRKSLRPIQRPSKGLQLLEQKVQMINKIHHVELKIITTDRQEIDPKTTGTQVDISFLKKTDNSHKQK